MMAGPLIVFEWDGDAMVPLSRFRQQCDRDFVVHEKYQCEVMEERSGKSHRHFMAMVGEYWLNLPESANLEPWAQNAETLRKYALIKTGYADTQTHICQSDAEAKRTAMILGKWIKDDYAIVIAKGAIVYIYTAKSQAMKAMGKKDFQESKDAVLSFLEGLVGARADGVAA